MAIPLTKALKEWELRQQARIAEAEANENKMTTSLPIVHLKDICPVASEAKDIGLYGGIRSADNLKLSFINRLDSSLATLKNCEYLRLSTNQIERMVSFAGMEKLRLLSLSRNALKKIERLDDVAETLEELWLSYNKISSLDGLSGLKNLRVLYMAHNEIKDWAEIEKLAALPSLREVLFIGNPIYNQATDDPKLMVLKRVPQLTKIDNAIVEPEQREAAAALP